MSEILQILQSTFHLRAAGRSPLTPRGELSPTPRHSLTAKEPCGGQHRGHTPPRLARPAKRTIGAISRLLLRKAPLIGSYACRIPAVVLVGFVASPIIIGMAFA